MSCDEHESTMPTNIERLRGHIEDGTLAAKLVDVYQTSTREELSVALKAIAEARLLEIQAAITSENLPNAPD